jgi:hypothetical protein
MQGADRQGRPVLLLQARKHVRTDSTSQQLCLCYALDAAIGFADTSVNLDSKMVGLIDLAGMNQWDLPIASFACWLILPEVYCDECSHYVILTATL